MADTCPGVLLYSTFQHLNKRKIYQRPENSKNSECWFLSNLQPSIAGIKKKHVPEISAYPSTPVEKRVLLHTAVLLLNSNREDADL